jgi:hypothetical protein
MAERKKALLNKEKVKKISIAPPNDDAYSKPTGPNNTLNNKAPATLLKGNWGCDIMQK